MKKILIAASVVSMFMTGTLLCGITAAAERIPPDAPVPDWVPTDFFSALEFSNKYGVTHIADDRICILEKQQTDEKYTYSEDLTATGDWENNYGVYRDVVFDSIPKPEKPEESSKEYFEYERQMRELEFLRFDEEKNAYITPFKFHMTVYEMQRDTTLTVEKHVKYGEKDFGTTTYTFACDKDDNLTETNINSWLPDCVDEYAAFKKEHNGITLLDNLIIYCGDLGTGTGEKFEITQCGTARLELIASRNLYPETLLPMAGGSTNMIRVYRALNNGLVKLTAATYLGYTDDPEKQHREETTEYFAAASPEEIITIDPGQFREPVPCDCNADDAFTIADVVMLQKYLLGTGEIYVWTNADIDGNNILNAVDLSLMKQALLKVYAQKPESEPVVTLKAEDDANWYYCPENSSIEVPYHFYLTIPDGIVPATAVFSPTLYNADTNETIKIDKFESAGTPGKFKLTVTMELSESEIRHYYVTVPGVDAKDGSNKTYKSNVVEWQVNLSREVPVPPAA